MQLNNRVVGAALIGFALLLGGGSALVPMPRLLIELLGAGVLAWYAARGWQAPPDWWTTAALLFLLLLLALPLAQLVPLPPSIWQALPGRADASAVIAEAGLAPRWMPISLEPDQTRQAAAFLIPPVAMFIATLHASTRDRMVFGWIIVGVAVAGALLGLLQATATADVYLYETSHRGAAVGLFANKNHHADLLVIGILLAAALARTSRQLGMSAPTPLIAGVVAVLALALPATNSRAGLILAPFAVLPAILLLIPPTLVRRARARHVLAVAAMMIVVAAIIAGSGTVHRALDRFGGDPDPRLRFWPDVLTALHRYQPIGSGLGSFVHIFQRDESIAALSFTYVNHAHNDVLEIMLEAGWAGAALLAAGAALLVAGAWRALRPSAWGAFTPVHAACALSMTALAAHSLIDYPLRTLALSCTLGFLAGCLAPAPLEGSARRSRRPTPSQVRLS